MPTTTDVIDKKVIDGHKACLWNRKQFALMGRGGIGKDIWVTVAKDEKYYRSQVIHITDRFDRRKDNLHMEANSVEDIEVVSDREIRVRLKGAGCDYWLSAYH